MCCPHYHSICDINVRVCVCVFKVVQDMKYFQRIKWQYMILDEAQAIKSSTRWVSHHYHSTIATLTLPLSLFQYSLEGTVEFQLSKQTATNRDTYTEHYARGTIQCIYNTCLPLSCSLVIVVLIIQLLVQYFPSVHCNLPLITAHPPSSSGHYFIL